MIENYIAALSLGEKRTLKEQLQKGFPYGEIDLNAMAFIYNGERDVVIVEGLVRGDAIDGLEFSMPDFTDMVNEVLSDVVLYETDEEEAAALRTYLAGISEADRKALMRRIPRLRNGREIALSTMEFIYDEERNSVVIDVRMEGQKLDSLELPLAHFLAVVKEVIGDVEVAE